VRVGVLLWPSVTFYSHGDARGVALGRRLEEFEQVAVGIDALGLRAHVLFEFRENPFLETRKMRVHPVVVPVELFWMPGEKRLLILANARHQRAHVVGTEDVSVLDRERAK